MKTKIAISVALLGFMSTMAAGKRTEDSRVGDMEAIGR